MFFYTTFNIIRFRFLENNIETKLRMFTAVENVHKLIVLKQYVIRGFFIFLSAKILIKSK